MAMVTPVPSAVPVASAVTVASVASVASVATVSPPEAVWLPVRDGRRWVRECQNDRDGEG